LRRSRSGFFHLRMVDQAEVIVRTDHDTFMPIHNDFIAGGGLKRVKEGIDAHRLNIIGISEIEALFKQVWIANFRLVLGLQEVSFSGVP
jgi:hypothetical protein